MKRSLLAILFTITIAMSGLAQASVGSSTPQTVSVTMTVSESLTFTLSTNSLALPYNGTASSPVTATVAYNLNGNVGHPQGIAYAWYFGSATAALAGGGVNVSPANLQGTLTGTDTGAATSCNQNSAGYIAGVPGAVCFAGSFALPTTPSQGTLTDNFTLKYTGGSLLTNTYTGTLNVVYYAP